MRSIVRWCLSNRAVVLIFAVIFMGSGVAAMFWLNQELLPSIDFPAVYVVTADPGASPEVVDRDVSQPLGNALTGIAGLKQVTTISAQGFSTVELQFDLDTQTKTNADAVNQRLTGVQLPAGVGRPSAQTFSFSAFPSITYSLAARDGNLLRATQEAQNVIAPALQGATGAAQVKVVGGEQKAITITLDPARLAARGVSSQEVSAALQGAQIDLPAGEATSGAKVLPVEVLGALHTVDDVRNLVVGAGGSGPGAGSPGAAGSFPGAPGFLAPGAPVGAPAPPVRLGDVASVTEGTAPLNGISRTNGAPSLSIQVVRAAGANAVNLSSDVNSRIAKLKLDPGDRLDLVNDSAVGIRASLNDLILEGLIGATLAIIVIFLFLGSLRATLVTAVSLPTSVLVALLGTQLGGFSLNVLTLAGLTIAVGRIVDDAIVVLENSYRHLQMGDDAQTAAENGAAEVSKAVISSTLTTVAVFLPIGFVGGIISKFFLPFSVTVTISLLASLLVAITLIPVLVSFLLSRPRAAAAVVGATAGAAHAPGRLGRLYRPALSWALGSNWRKAGVLALAGVLLAASIGTTVAFVPKNFFDFGTSDTLTGEINLPPGTSTQQTGDAVRQFETAAQADPDVKLVQSTLGSTDYGGFSAGYATNNARLTVVVKNAGNVKAVGDRLKARLADLYGAGNVSLAVNSPGPPASSFQVAAKGRDVQALRHASDQIVAELQKNPDLADVKSSLAAQKPEVRITVDPNRAAAAGISPRAVALIVAGALGTQSLGTLGSAGPLVTLRLDPASQTADRLGMLPVGPGVALKDIASVTEDTAAESITRVDGTQQVTVTANVLAKDVSGASAKADAAVARLTLPAGVALDTGGGTGADIASSFTAMFQAMAVAIALVFVILVVFFRSLLTPFVILMTMPLALIGGLFALAITGKPLGLPSLLGVLMVFGIVVSNAILLIDFVERIADRTTMTEALLEAGMTRVRPILMTAVATIAALVPVAVGVSTSGGGGLISQGLAVVVEGGLISSTFMTLLVIPIAYSLVKRRPTPPAAAAAEPPPAPTPSGGKLAAE